MSEAIWTPDPATAAQTNVGRFQAAHGIEQFDELLARSIADPAWFWGEVGGALRRISSGWSVEVQDILDEIAGNRSAFMAERDARALDCLATWALNHDRH